MAVGLLIAPLLHRRFAPSFRSCAGRSRAPGPPIEASRLDRQRFRERGLGAGQLVGLEHACDDPAWNSAIFRLYTLMQDGPGRLYVASTAPPASLRFRLPDLRSRLLAAPVHQLQELDEAGQIEALTRRAAARGLELPREAALYLVHRMPRDMHSLSGVFDRLDEAALAAQRRLTVPFLRQVLDAQASGAS